MTYPIPDSALDDRLAFIGTSGSGKTYNAGGAIERLLATGARCAIVDPLGVWWGLRLNADGSPSKHNVVIFGGEHGDLPLNENAGKIIGETVATMAESCIIDLSALNSKAAERRFMLAFLEAVYRNATRDPLHMPIDEADMFAPQRGSDEPRLQALMEQIVRRGRTRGFIPWLITQRPAVLSKDVLSQADGLVAFKLTASQDRKALGDWVRAQADEGQWNKIDAQLPTMQQGQGIVWLPSHGILETVAFPRKATFDSSRTPKRGERVERKQLKPLDLDKLKGKLASIEEEAKASDPRALKAEVARLTRSLADASKGSAPSWPDQREEVAALRHELAECGAALERLTTSAKQLEQRHRKALAALTGDAVTIPEPVRQTAVPPTLAAPTPRPSPPRAEPRQVDGGLRPSHQRVVDALAWWKAAGFASVERRRACIMAGYSPKASTFGVYISELARDGLVEVPEPGHLRLTEAGESVAAAPDMTSPDAILQAARDLLSPAEIRLFDELAKQYPEWLSRGELADRVGLSRTASTLGVYLSKIGSFGFTKTQPGSVRLDDWLFP